MLLSLSHLMNVRLTNLVLLFHASHSVILYKTQDKQQIKTSLKKSAI